MDEQHNHADNNDVSAVNGVGSGVGKRLERALARLTVVDEHLRKVDEHVSRARAAERPAPAG